MDKDDIPVYEEAKPEYGVNYGRGWIGFNHASSWMSKGIALLTRHQRKHGVAISHALVVTGEDECVEAAFGKGVVVSSLNKQYFDNPDRYIVFRKPRGLTDEMADRVVEAARKEVGVEFDNSILVGGVVNNTFLSHVVDTFHGGDSKDFVAQLSNDDDRWICSELAAHCLRLQPEFDEAGVLQHPDSAIEPQRLFEADELFEPFDEA